MINFEQWEGFEGRIWKEEVNVRDFIQKNYTPYDGDESFLAGPTEATDKLWGALQKLQKAERAKGGVLDMETEVVSSLTAYGPGYIDESLKDLEQIVGLQTDKPLKRAFMPYGGIKMAEQACTTYGYQPSEELHKIFTDYTRTHNQAVFDAYTPEMRACRSNHIITGLPDAYGRGRIIGDYRRVALYGVERLIAEKKADKAALAAGDFDSPHIRLAEELSCQIAALHALRDMAKSYGFDISAPATNAKEAIQWTYFAYLAAIKEQNGAAMSLGRVSTFFDIYIERDMAAGVLTEEGAQELVDDFVIKLRLARHLRTPEYNELFGGDPMWITESVGGMGEDGRTLVTKTSFRMLNTIYTLGPAPEPNLTVLWAAGLPAAFKRFCAKVSCDTDSIQYENDDRMRPLYGDDYAIACCVSAMQVGKQMQFFGARCNLPKLLLLALNGGFDAESGIAVGPAGEVMQDEVLDFDRVMQALKTYMQWAARLYVNTMNVIHYMHDKYAYEASQMALHDTAVHRFMAFGVAGLSVITDSLSAIRYAAVKPIRNEAGYIVDFEAVGDFPKFGNDDDRVDSIACALTEAFLGELRKTPAYRGAEHTLSVLTITSNVMYGKKTGATPDGRLKGVAFAPGANPMHGRDKSGAIASLASVAKMRYRDSQDGISNTFSIVPKSLGPTAGERIENLVTMLDGYFTKGAHHLNVNVLNREMLEDAMEHPEKYPQLTIRVSGYAVNFTKLSREHQLEVISRSFHERM